MNNPIIFLDIDGVLALDPQWSLNRTSKSWISKYDCYPFDKKCVNVLNEILKETDAEIVVSSDWRTYFNLNELKEIFDINGVIKHPIGITPLFPTSALFLEKNRASEILSYVDDNAITSYIAIDDLDMTQWLGSDHFAYCRSLNEGIKQSGLKDKIMQKIKALS